MNAKELLRRASLFFVLMSLTCNGVIRADVADPSSSVRFSYEGQRELTGSPIFPGPTTDYYWGEVQKHEAAARHQRHHVYPSDPQNPCTYTASFAEWFALDPHTILIFIETTEYNAEDPPQSIEEAKALLQIPCPTSNKQVQRYFETVPQSAQEKLLQGFPFLGMTPEGPIWKMCQPMSVGDGRQKLFACSSSDGTEYHFEFDRNLFRRCSISSGQKPSPGRAASSGEPLINESNMLTQGGLYTSEIVDDRDGMTLIAMSIQDAAGTTKKVTRITDRVFNFERNHDQPISMMCMPVDDEKIVSLEDSQLLYSWKKGKIVRVVEQPFVQDVAQWQFMTAFDYWRIDTDMLIGIAAVSIVASMVRKRCSLNAQAGH